MGHKRRKDEFPKSQSKSCRAYVKVEVTEPAQYNQYDSITVDTLSDTASRAASPSIEVTKTRESTRIALWNYKGGVAKTTLLLNLAATFAQFKNKVLIVDGDQQANTTQHLYPEESPVSFWFKPHQGGMKTGKHGVEQGVDVIPSSYPNDPRVMLHTNDQYVTLSKLLMDCHANYDKFKATLEEGEVALPVNTGEVDRGLGGYLFILPGDAHTVEFESKLKEAPETDAPSVRTQTAFDQILTTLDRKHSFDYIFVDLGPSAGKLNRCFATACDYILPPSMVDSYSLQAIHGTFTKVLPSWKERHACHTAVLKPALENMDFELGGLRWREQFPTVLPVVVGNYDTVDEDAKEMCFNDTCLFGSIRWEIFNLMALKRAHFIRDKESKYEEVYKLYTKKPSPEAEDSIPLTNEEKANLRREAKRVATVPWYTDQFMEGGIECTDEDMVILGCRKFRSAVLPVAHELGRTIPELRVEDFDEFIELTKEDEMQEKRKKKTEKQKRKARRESSLAKLASIVTDETQRLLYVQELEYAKKEYTKLYMFLKDLGGSNSKYESGSSST